MKPSNAPKPVPQPLKLALLICAASLQACATNSPPQTPVCPPPPTPPFVSTPQPSMSYSESAKQRTQIWREKLKGTRLMSGS